MEIATLLEMHSGQSARVAMEKLVLSKMPSQAGASVEVTLQSLRDVREGDQYRFADIGVQHVLDNAYDALSQLQNHRPPHQSHMQDEWGKQILMKMPYFLTHEVEEENGEKHSVAGPDAYAAKLAQCQSRAKKSVLAMDHLAPLHTYEWIASVEQKQQLQQLTDNLIAGIKTNTKRREVKEEKKKKKMKKHESSSSMDADMDVDALFG